jgi:carboxyl-terminal processing protease
MSSQRSKFKLAGKRAALLAVILAIFITGVLVGNRGFASVGADGNLQDQDAYSTFEQTWDLIQSQYVDPSSINSDDLLHAATAGMVNALGDTGHSTFLDPLEVQTSDPELSGEYIGIGVELDYSGLLPRIISAIEGGPADKAGIVSGDVIAKINGTKLDGMTSAEISKLIRGKEGTTVDLTIERAGTPDFDVTLTRSKITVDPVSWWMIGDHIAHIRFSQFSQQAADELRQTIKDAEDAGATAFILDLRDNSGGLVTEALSVGGAFLPEGSTMFQVEDRDGNKSDMTVTDGTNFDYPLVVLINDGTASAGEITAAAISESGVGTTVGETTYGTGTVLSSFSLDDGSLLVLGTQLWLTPSGKSVWKVGVNPQIPVELADPTKRVRPTNGETMTSAQLAQSGDTQLQEGVALLTQETGDR